MVLVVTVYGNECYGGWHLAAIDAVCKPGVGIPETACYGDYTGKVSKRYNTKASGA